MRARILFFVLGIALFCTAAQAQPVITFDTNEIVVGGASGHSVALLLEGTRQLIGAKDPDGDGLTRFPHSYRHRRAGRRLQRL